MFVLRLYLPKDLTTQIYLRRILDRKFLLVLAGTFSVLTFSPAVFDIRLHSCGATFSSILCTVAGASQS